ncbi:MAG: hypothetical protein K0B81_09505 [Candidatus Cloacimonetes bacterium]|nr:hypothetical protein [Candidatus Cloacimonadota bacterium]
MKQKVIRRIFNLIAGIFLVIGGNLISPPLDLRVLTGIIFLIMCVLIYLEYGTFQNTIDKRIEKKIKESIKE